MVDLTLEQIGWTWTGLESVVWEATTCTLVLVVSNAQVPRGQDDWRQDLRITFRDATYFKVLRDHKHILNQIEVERLAEVASLPSLGTLDGSGFHEVRAPGLAFGDEYAGEALGRVGEVRMFVLIASGFMAEFAAGEYKIEKLARAR